MQTLFSKPIKYYVYLILCTYLYFVIGHLLENVFILHCSDPTPILFFPVETLFN